MGWLGGCFGKGGGGGGRIVGVLMCRDVERSRCTPSGLLSVHIACNASTITPTTFPSPPKKGPPHIFRTPFAPIPSQPLKTSIPPPHPQPSRPLSPKKNHLKYSRTKHNAFELSPACGRGKGRGVTGDGRQETGKRRREKGGFDLEEWFPKP